MPDQKSLHKLTADQQLEVCKLLAMGCYGLTSVVDKIKEKYGIEITKQTVYGYAKRKAKFIKILTKRMNNKLGDHIAMQKSTRINALNDALSTALKWSPDKLYFDKNGKLRGRVDKKTLGVITGLVNQLKIEAEGDRSLITISVSTVINQIHNIVDSKKEKEEDGESRHSLVTRESFNIVE